VSDPRSDAAGLRAFVAVARQGTVAGAAERLGRTQPSISARLAALERAWGTRVFRRLARGMALTPEGARLLPLAEAALLALEAVDRAAGLPAAGSGTLRVGAGDALGRELLPRALARLARRHPGLAVFLREGPRHGLLDALRQGEIDLALVVRAGNPAVEGIDEAPWIESGVDVLAPPGTWPRRERAPLDLAALRKHRFVVLQRGSAFRAMVEAACATARVPFVPAVEVGNLSLVRRFVAAGLGVAPVPAIAFGRDATSDPPVARRPLRGVPPVVYARAVRRGAPLSGVATELLALLRPPGAR